MAINYFRTVLVASIRLATIILIVGVFNTIIETINNTLSATTTTQPNVIGNLNDILELLVTALMMYLLIKTIPELLASLAKGILGSNNHQSDPANAYANALMQQQLYASSSAGGGRSSRSAAEVEAEQHAQQLAASRMAQHDATKAEERARAATAYTKPESPKPPPTTSSSSDYIHGVDFSNIKYPNPDAPPPSDD